MEEAQDNVFRDLPEDGSKAPLSAERLECACGQCAYERRRRGIVLAGEPLAVVTDTPDEEAVDRDFSFLLPSSLAYDRDWSILIAGRRFAGGEPIDFKSIYREVYKDRAKAALYADFAGTQASLDGRLRVDAMDRSDLEDSPDDNEWMVVTAYARTKGLGPRQGRKIMERLLLLQEEIEVRMQATLTSKAGDYLGETKPDYRTTSRLAVWATQAGLGRRMKSKSGIEFDVLSPQGVKWLNARWPMPIEKAKTQRGRPSSIRAEVHRLLGQGKTQAEVAKLTGASRQAVSYHAKAVATAHDGAAGAVK